MPRQRTLSANARPLDIRSGKPRLGNSEEIDSEFGFTLDCCAEPHTAKVATYFTEADDCLSQDWGTNVCWMNPPYRADLIGRFLQKAISASKGGATVVALVPSYTDTKWWQQNVCGFASEVRFGPRLKFQYKGVPIAGARFGVVLLVYRPDFDGKTIIRPWKKAA